MSVLDKNKLLASDLWLDQPDAEERIRTRLSAGELNEFQASKLKGFVRDGFLSFNIDLSKISETIENDVNRLWRERPTDLTFAYSGALESMADGREREHRKPRYRLGDLHSHSDAALELYLHPEIHNWVDLVLGWKSVAFQSLYFQFGSEQSLHRDPVYVVTNPPSHLVAIWIALEDIGPECGPLTYVPGSHKVPYYEFEPGRIAIQPGEDYLPAYDFTREECSGRSLEEVAFTGRRGDVFLWHGSLVHGGSAVEDPASTRRSFVIHFSTQGNYKVRGSTFTKKGSAGVETISRQTEKLLRRGDAVGFDNPVRGFRPSSDHPSSTSLVSKLKRRLLRLKG